MAHQIKKSLVLAITGGLYATVAVPALAQVPTQVDPSKVEKRFEPRISSGSEKETRVAPSVPQTPALSAEAAAKSFVLRSVNIEGSTVYTKEQLTPVFVDKLNTRITMGEAQSIAQQITLKYRNDGYILSQARVNPSVRDGVLTIEVIEGFIHNVIIEGEAEKQDRSLVKAYGDKIAAERPLHISTLERYLLLLDDLPGATAKGVVRPSPSTFGAADLVVTMAHKTYAGSLTLDNRGTKFIGPYQLSGTLAANSLLGMSERTLVRAATTVPMDELVFFEAQHEQQIGTEGTRILFNASHSETEPGSSLSSLNIEAESTAFGIRAEHPFIRSRAENLNGRVEFDYRNTDTDLVGANFSNDRLRVLRLGGEYDFLDAWSGVDLIDVELSQGLNIFNASETGTRRSRTDGESDFKKILVNIARNQPIFTRQLSLYTAAAGQYSADKLLASEQFSLGGATFGSAYDAAEISGDHGLAARAELRYGDQVGEQYLASYQVYGFYDIGSVWNRGAVNNQQSLASTGVGVRANLTEAVSGSLELALPLTRDVASENDDDPRLFFSLTGRF